MAPAEQLEHAVVALRSEYLPMAQLVQKLEPAAEKVPARQPTPLGELDKRGNVWLMLEKK